MASFKQYWLIIGLTWPWMCAESAFFQYSKFRGRTHLPPYDYEVPSLTYEDDPYEYSSSRTDYSFEFGVNDEDERNVQSHRERRKGDVVEGEYSVLDPDGRLRTVSYSVRPHTGFLASSRSVPYSRIHY